jgi:hypothetical protein
LSAHRELEALLVEDAPSGGRRQEILRHVRDCAQCRSGLLAHDPARLFALLALEPLPAEALERLSRRVALDVEAREPRSWRRYRTALAASLVLGGALGLYLALRRPDAPAPVAEGRPIEVERLLGQTAPAAGIELLSSPGPAAEVLAFSVGDTQVVMIFDEELDL